MKLTIVDDLVILYLNKLYIKNLDLTDKISLEKYLKKLFNKLKNKYDLEFDGYYDVTIHVDKNYGVIIEVKKEELEYLDYFSNQIELNTKVVEDSFLYEGSLINNYLLNKVSFYKLDDKIYLKIKTDITNIEMAQMLETADVIYGKKAKKIIEKAKVLR